VSSMEGSAFSISAYANASLIPTVFFYTDSTAIFGFKPFPDAPNVIIYSINPLRTRIGGGRTGSQEITARGERRVRYASVVGDGCSDRGGRGGACANGFFQCW